MGEALRMRRSERDGVNHTWVLGSRRQAKAKEKERVGSGRRGYNNEVGQTYPTTATTATVAWLFACIGTRVVRPPSLLTYRQVSKADSLFFLLRPPSFHYRRVGSEVTR